MISSPRNWSNLLLLAVCLLAFALRVIVVYRYGFDTPRMVGSTESGEVAKNLAEGRGYTFVFYGTRRDSPLRSFLPPLFPALIATCLFCFENPARALGIIHAILSSLTVLILYGIAVKLSSKRIVGLLASVGMAVYPVFVIMCAYPPSLTLNMFCLSLFLLAGIVLQERMTLAQAALTGFLLGVLLLTRPMMAGFLPVLIIWLWINHRGDKALLLKVTVMMGVFMGLTVLPWTLRNYYVHGRIVFVATNGGFNFWNGNNPFTTGSGHEVYTELADNFLGVPHDSDSPPVREMRPYPLPEGIRGQLATISEVELDRLLYSAGLAFIQDNPGRWWELAKAKFEGFWWFRENIGSKYEESWTKYYKVLYAALFLCFLIGGFASLRQWRRYFLLYLLLVYYTVFYVLYHVQTRFRWEIEPFLLIFAAIVPSFFFDRLTSRRPAENSS